MSQRRTEVPEDHKQLLIFVSHYFVNLLLPQVVFIAFQHVISSRMCLHPHTSCLFDLFNSVNLVSTPELHLQPVSVLCTALLIHMPYRRLCTVLHKLYLPILPFSTSSLIFTQQQIFQVSRKPTPDSGMQD